MRILTLFILLALLFALPLVIFGERFDRAFVAAGGVEWLRGYGAWAWAVAMGLLVADLVLPVPATPVMSALGMLYGTLWGGLIGAAGSMLAGTMAYGAARLIGPRAAEALAGREELARAKTFFDRSGGWAVAVARPLPLLAEVIACLAGLAGMKAGRFFLSLACGSIPFGLAFAALGAFNANRPIFALAVSAAAPLALWPAVRRLTRPATSYNEETCTTAKTNGIG